MKGLSQDISFAGRTLAKSPGFALVAVLTLALGIGANGAVVSVLRGLLLRPLLYPHPEELVMVWSRWSDFAKTVLSVPEYRTYLDSGCFSGLALFQPVERSLTGGGEPERIASALITANLFDVLGVKPKLGRGFTASEVSAQPANVVILSDELWRRRFDGSPGIVGRSVNVNGAPKIVVGIMPAGFKLPLDYNSKMPSQLWLPLDEEVSGTFTFPHSGGDHNFDAVGRLRPGMSLAQARARLTAIAASLTARGYYLPAWHYQPLVNPVISDVLGPLRIALLVLCGAVGFVLLIACTNVANLLLVRGLHRRREFAVRMALGAAPLRLVRQLLIESVVLSMLGGGVGLFLTYCGVRAIVLLDPAEIPRIEEIGMDGGVVSFVALLSLATAVIFGLAPAIRFARGDLQTALRNDSRGVSGGRDVGRLQNLMVLSEVALAVVLLMGASLMIRTFWSLSRVSPGFQTANVLTLGLSPDLVKYKDPQSLTRLYAGVLDNVRRLPGVQSAGAVRRLPLATDMGDHGMDVEGYAPPSGDTVRGEWQAVTPGYFESMGIPMLHGRLFSAADRQDTQAVIIVSQAMAERFWPGGDAIGHRIRVAGAAVPPWSTVIGVVGDVHHNGLMTQARGTFYLPQSQFNLSTGFSVSDMTLVVKTGHDPAAFVSPVRAEIREVDPQLPVSRVRSLRDVAEGALSKQRFTMFFLLLCSALALILAAIGVYAVVRFRVSSRQREIGLRMALGAQPAQVTGLIIRQSLVPIGLGLTAGALVALALTHFLGSLLYGVKAQDPFTLLAAAVVLGLVGLGATYLPARRAALIDPAIVLSQQ